MFRRNTDPNRAAQQGVAVHLHDLIVGHGFHDGTVALEAQPTMLAIRAELEEMIRQIDAVKYAAE